MRIGFIGLGKMGYNMCLNLLEHKHEVVAYDVNKKAVGDIAKEGATAAYSLKEVVEKLEKPRVLWLMIPHQFVDDTIKRLAGLLDKGDIIVDGGNSYYKLAIQRAEELKKKGIAFLDVGTSGGKEGARHGACMMIGGEKKVYESIEQLFKDMTTKEGYFYCGPSGAGHFVKMVHNGVEYGMMQAYAEGFELLKEGPYKEIEFKGVAHVWNHGSIVKSFLLEKAESALAKDPKLEKIDAYVEDTGEGRWTINTAVEHAVSVPVLATALFNRFKSRRKDSFGDKLLAAMRFEFGGHAVKKK